NEYFTKFKFIQFGLQYWAAPDRTRAAVVGFMASWWMGLPLGIFCGAAGLMQRSASLMLRSLAWSLPVIASFTLVVALVGLSYGWFATASIDLAQYRGWFIPPNITGLRRAGYMHNSAYLGGALSIPLAWIFHWGYRRRHRASVASRF